MACPCCGHDPTAEPRRRFSSAERAQRAREADKRYYAKVKEERRIIFRDRRRVYYEANRDQVCQRKRELRALAKKAKEEAKKQAQAQAQAHQQIQAQAQAQAQSEA